MSKIDWQILAIRLGLAMAPFLVWLVVNIFFK